MLGLRSGAQVRAQCLLSTAEPTPDHAEPWPWLKIRLPRSGLPARAEGQPSRKRKGDCATLGQHAAHIPGGGKSNCAVGPTGAPGHAWSNTRCGGATATLHDRERQQPQALRAVELTRLNPGWEWQPVEQQREWRTGASSAVQMQEQDGDSMATEND